MLRIPVTILALYASILSAFSQATDTARYEDRKLKVDEVNFVSSYYRQDGNNAAVTGGTGSEKLTDFATTIDVHLLKTDRKHRINSYNIELGIDTYTSASSDKIDPSTVSSASSADQRIYPSIAWSRINESKGSTIGANFSLSSEYDYFSVGGGINAFKDSKDRSRQVGIRLQTFQDAVTLIYPIEQRAGRKGGTEARNTYSATVSYSQIVNTRLQLLFLLDLAYQKGFLSLPFNRVYFSDNTAGIEHLPGARFKVPASVRLSYFLGDRIVVRAFYRYYQDDWGLRSNTAELETPVKITPFFSISPFYRYYNQSAIDYFAPYKQHASAEVHYTSDYDLSKFDSHLFGTGIRFNSADGILGIGKFNTVEIRYGHYTRQTGLVSNIISLHAKFK
ncbi:DUF3570 domain-containing protein [Dawidia soli]|uniref:DUF3570 domain-containing protein n=1 Tax=Dawidia soli TaxID=2782352 RepID=A0AAP2D997_9BACT|nr:DUF3570 domain-containing protein [Dawidia soli]MBT1686445.1 DUF3570 domain-containing protein [Dawidia soli]